MVQLIKNIEGKVYSENKGTVVFKKSVIGEIQLEDYINLNGFVMCLQNLSATEQTSRLSTQLTVGLENKYNIELNTLEIDTNGVTNSSYSNIYE